jgi:hypothetical protein
VIKRLLITSGLAISLMLVCSCATPLLDSSSAAEYSEVVGRRYRLIQDLCISGLTVDRGSQRRLAYYAVMRRPGGTGPEYISNELLPSGTEVRVIGIKARRHLFDAPTVAVIELPGLRQYADKQVVMYILRLQEKDARTGHFRLDPAVFIESRTTARLAVPQGNQPNKAPEPTPRPVTDRANARSAPGRVVAHL